MSKALRNVQCLLEHHYAEWNHWYPRYKANDAEDADQNEDYASRTIVAIEVIYRCPNAEGSM